MINMGKVVNAEFPEVSLEYELTSEVTLLFIGILPGPLVSNSKRMFGIFKFCD